MNGFKPLGNLKEWHVWTAIFLAFGAFIVILYGVCKGIAWTLEKLFA